MPGAETPAVTAGEVTALVSRLGAGDPEALDRLYPLVYEELRRVARRQLRGERPDHTLQPTALVNEAYLKLAGGGLTVRDRAHFVAVAARAMRQVLVDHSRRRGAAKRGGGAEQTTLSGVPADLAASPEEIIALDAALERLEQQDARLCRVVEYRFFGGLTDSDIGELLGVTPRTVHRDWVKARAWLYAELYPERAEGDAGDG